MHWTTAALDQLSRGPVGYHAGDPPAVEPTALAALALFGAGRNDDAAPALAWLAKNQRTSGSLPPYTQLDWPGWTSPLAILAGVTATRAAKNAVERSAGGIEIDQAKAWLLSVAGNPLPPSPDIGHDVTLIGWPWVVGTHSWQEPTAWSVLALKSLGLANHARTREGVRLLVDRLLPDGGCNYGNTFVLGQFLRPHIEPTGLTMIALAGEKITDPRIEHSLKYLESAMAADTAAMSLSYGLLGLAAHNRAPADAADRLEAAYERTKSQGAAPFQLALLALASQQRTCPLLQYTAA